MSKSAEAFRTISEVAEWLGIQAHVLRFWESKFTQVKPVKRAGGRRYYRPADMQLIGGIKKLLHEDGLTIKAAQALLREKGISHVAGLSQPLDLPSGAPQTVDSPTPPPSPADDPLILQDPAPASGAEPDEAVPDKALPDDQPALPFEQSPSNTPPQASPPPPPAPEEPSSQTEPDHNPQPAPDEPPAPQTDPAPHAPSENILPSFIRARPLPQPKPKVVEIGPLPDESDIQIGPVPLARAFAIRAIPARNRQAVADLLQNLAQLRDEMAASAQQFGKD